MEQNISKATTRRSLNFSEGESKSLLKIWSSAEFQNEFQKSKRHTHIWTKISVQLYKSGVSEDGKILFPQRDNNEVSNKFRNMKREYTVIKNRHSGDDAIDTDEFPYYELFEAVLGSRPSFDPIKTIDSLEASNLNRVDGSTPVVPLQEKELPPVEKQTALTRTIKSGKKRLADSDFNAKYLEIQKKQLKLAEESKDDDKNLTSSMKSFFDAGANYFNAKAAAINANVNTTGG